MARSLQAHAHAGGPESLSSYTRLRGKRVAAVNADDDVPATGSSTSTDDSTGVGGGGETASRDREVADVEKQVKKVGRT